MRWREIIRNFMNDPIGYLKEYFHKSDTEAGFSADKRSARFMIFQRRKDRNQISGFCNGILHSPIFVNG